MWKSNDYFKNKDKNGYQRPIDFTFTFRNSVEHFYPQNPGNNNPTVPNVDHFGNLALITRSQNSKHSNLMPVSKKAEYEKSASQQSLKLQLMMKTIGEKEHWDNDAIESHGESMIKLLQNSLKEKNIY